LLITAELKFLAQYGLEFERSEYIQRFTGTSLTTWEASVAKLISDVGLIPPTQEDFRELADTNDREIKMSLTAVKGAHLFLSKTTHANCVASSSTPAQLDWKLKITGLERFFDGRVYSSSHVKNGKPAPDLFLFAASRMQVSPSDCLVIEDSASGIRAAKKACMTAIGLVAASHCPPGYGEVLLQNGADFIAEDYGELADWVEAW